MRSPSSTVLHSAPTVGWGLPLLGGVLAGLGIMLLAGGEGAIDWPASSVRPPTAPAVLLDAVPVQAIPPLPGRRDRHRAGGETWTGPGEAVQAAAARPRRPADCLGADLATGHRAESMHLATAPVQRPADCGDVRDVLMGVTSLPRVVRDGVRSGSEFTDAALAETTDVDLAAAALYGPPDRYPQPTQEALLEEGVADGGRGRARDYLEETAATRFLGP